MSPIYDSVRWGVPVRGTLILGRRHSEVGWPAPFLAAFNFPSVATRYPFAAGWTVSEHPNYDLRVRVEPPMFCSAVKRSNHFATIPLDWIYVCLILVMFYFDMFHQLCKSPEKHIGR